MLVQLAQFEIVERQVERYAIVQRKIVKELEIFPLNNETENLNHYHWINFFRLFTNFSYFQYTNPIKARHVFSVIFATKGLNILLL